MYQREIIHFLFVGVTFTQEEMATAVHVTRYKVRKLYDQIDACHLSYEELLALCDEDLINTLEMALNPERKNALPRDEDFDAPRWLSMIENYGSNGRKRTRQYVWSETYCPEMLQNGKQPLKYSQFCNLILKFKKTAVDFKMPINRVPGKEMFVDWAGDKAQIVDFETGTLIFAYVFVATVGTSGFPFVGAYASMAQIDWIQAHLDAFDRYEGLPRVIVPDNTKTAVEARKLYNTQLNTAYREFSYHYKVAIVPARVREPRDKGSVENCVGWLEDWLFPWLEDNGPFDSLVSLNEAIQERVRELCEREYTDRQGTRNSVFETVDKPAMRELVRYPFEYFNTVKTTTRGYMVKFDGFEYSVPYDKVNKKGSTPVEIRVFSKKLEFWIKGKIVATHPRAYTGDRKIVNPDHMPPNHKAQYEFSQQDADYYREKAKELGDNVVRVINQLLAEGPIEEQEYHSCNGIVKLADKYEAGALDEACAKALSIQSVCYTTIHNILKSRDNSTPTPKRSKQKASSSTSTATEDSTSKLHENVRTDWK